MQTSGFQTWNQHHGLTRCGIREIGAHIGGGGKPQPPKVSKTPGLFEMKKYIYPFGQRGGGDGSG